MRNLPEIRDEVSRYIQDKDQYLNENDIDSAIDKACNILSLRSPYSVFEDFTGDGTSEEWAFDTDLWLNGFSSITAVYYPWDITNSPTPPPPVDKSAYTNYEKTSGTWYFRMNAIIPSAAEVVRVCYSSLHSISDHGTTITSKVDEDSVIMLAAGFCLDMMAVRAISVGDSTIGADTVIYQSRQAQYAAMSKSYKQQSGLASYLTEDKPRGALTFASLGKKQRAVENF